MCAGCLALLAACGDLADESPSGGAAKGEALRPLEYGDWWSNPAIAEIRTDFSTAEDFGVGTGFFIAPHVLVTARHVLDLDQQMRVRIDATRIGIDDDRGHRQLDIDYVWLPYDELGYRQGPDLAIVVTVQPADLPRYVSLAGPADVVSEGETLVAMSYGTTLKSWRWQKRAALFDVERVDVGGVIDTHQRQGDTLGDGNSGGFLGRILGEELSFSRQLRRQRENDSYHSDGPQLQAFGVFSLTDRNRVGGGYTTRYVDIRLHRARLECLVALIAQRGRQACALDEQASDLTSGPALYDELREALAQMRRARSATGEQAIVLGALRRYALNDPNIHDIGPPPR
ncbi:MAG: trypsin-like peptidase domain-containing protein [Deltaproteobacteria bacterium]|nr:trypsin-like peptidase domain-containing protein [Deltaproteobacteria bacterium]